MGITLVEVAPTVSPAACRWPEHPARGPAARRRLGRPRRDPGVDRGTDACGRRARAVGIEINATHHRGVRSGSVHGVATALHLGRTTASYEIVVVDDEMRRVCTARLTCMVLDAR
ncbi:hotdog fold thioesterase [Oerskovia sp. M15]